MSTSHDPVQPPRNSELVNEELDARFIEQEHRLTVAILNFARLSKDQGRRREAAIKALASCLTARALRAAVVASVGVVGFAGLFFAWQANLLLSEQNQRLDLQTHLMESQRRASLIFELSSILDQIEKEKDRLSSGTDRQIADKSGPNSTSAPTSVAFRQSKAVSGRIAALSRSLRPYLYLTYDSASQTEVVLLKPLDFWTRISAAIQSTTLPNRSALPSLVSRPLSPERGQLLLTLLSSGIDLSEVALMGATFADADLSDRLIKDATIPGLDMEGASFAHARLMSVEFTHAGQQQPPRLDRADFTCAWFYGASLGVATLNGTRFAFVNLSDLSFDVRIRDGTMRPPGVDLAHLARADLTNADFDGVLLSSPSWLHPDFQGSRPKGFDPDRWRLEETADRKFRVRDKKTSEYRAAEKARACKR